MHSTAASHIGESKESADHYAVQSPVWGANKRKAKNTTKNRNKQKAPNKKPTPNTQKHKTKNTKLPRSDGRALVKKEATYVPMNSSKILQKAIPQPTRHHSKIAVKVQKQTTDQQCRNPGSPQPGSRRSHCEAHRSSGTFKRM